MDLRELIFPFLMAIITNSLMIVIIYFLRKTQYFTNLFGIVSMVILYLFCVLRMFLPIELPGIQVIVRDNVVYNNLIEVLIKRNPDGPGTPSVLFFIIIGVWLTGAVILGVVYLIKQKSFIRYILSNSDEANDDERALLKTIAAEILGTDKNIGLRKSDAVSRIMVIGFLKKTILLPDTEFPTAQLEMILRHECTHIKNKDLWLKLLIQIYCCVFWWNPFSYLLKHDLDFSLEMRCDLSVIKNFDDAGVLQYLDTIHSSVKQQTVNNEKRKESFLVCAELSDARKNKELIKRVKAITSEPPKKAKQITVNAAAAVLMLAVFAASFVFILQPFYGYEADDDLYDLNEGAIVVDDTNSYLVRQDDGSYLFYYKEYSPEVVSAEEVEQGLYKGYPILEN